MALANIAELLCARGLTVLMVDWDLEAPGLHQFFANRLSPQVLSHSGVVDLIQTFRRLLAEKEVDEKTGKIVPSATLRHFLERGIRDAYTIPISTPRSKQLKLLTPGRRDARAYRDYVDFVQTFDWLDFYENGSGAAFFDWLREQFLSIADVVLIDTRTGITEIGGICTHHLADVVVLLTNTTEQCLEGTAQIGHDLKRDEITRLRGDRPVEVLIVPSRVDRDPSEETRFVRRFEQLVGDLLPRSTTARDAFYDLEIPYVPEYSFRERIVTSDSDARDERLVRAYDRVIQAMTELAPPSSSIRRAGKFQIHFQVRKDVQTMKIALGKVSRDMIPYRDAVSQALDGEGDLVCISLQEVSSSLETKLIEDANTLIFILGFGDDRGGTQGVSAMERQIDKALSRRKPCLFYLARDDTWVPAITLLDSESKLRQNRLKERIQSKYLATSFGSLEDLTCRVLADIRKADIFSTAGVSEMDNSKYLWDVFISYSHEDADWVQSWLLPRIEAAGLKVCIDYRDFSLGTPVLHNIERAIERSRRTLLVLTPAYIASEWAEFEHFILQVMDPGDRERRLIPVLLTECQLPPYLAMLACLPMRDIVEATANRQRLIEALR